MTQPEDKPPQDDSLLSRMKQMSLAKWGLICIFSGMMSAGVMGPLLSSGDMSRAERRASQMGSAIAGALVVIAGVVLIVMHFVKAKRK